MCNTYDQLFDEYERREAESNRPTVKINLDDPLDGPINVTTVKTGSGSAGGSLLADVEARIGDRQGGYGQEDAFQDIAERLSLWIKQRFGASLTLTASDAADLLAEFKQARRLVRLRQGIVKYDDTVDQVGYTVWRNRKEVNKSRV